MNYASSYSVLTSFCLTFWQNRIFLQGSIVWCIVVECSIYHRILLYIILYVGRIYVSLNAS